MIATYYCDQHAEEYARKHDQAWPVPVVEEAAHA
jgi:L-rhamnose mutarotase